MGWDKITDCLSNSMVLIQKYGFAWRNQRFCLKNKVLLKECNGVGKKIMICLRTSMVLLENKVLLEKFNCFGRQVMICLRHSIIVLFERYGFALGI